uniref:bifunctional helix-turn-helix transcriptional regulator/GNAT family N-acetyltransferase n=1 Tax=Thaumasiovibrio occultus TaxID=1891184 RepID=UPI000B3638BA|nr:bifunctional helix-turn-helix transcriptional regulator/GNAT family N-acetyltransferase [Thaumasiovibrio occultus]
MEATTLRALSRHLVRELGMLDQQCGLNDITPVQAHVLIELEHCALTVNELAQRLKVDKSNASRTAAILLNKGLVATRPDSDDKRKSLNFLTTEGHLQLAQLNASLNHQVDQFMSHMDSDEIAQLATLMTVYTKAIQHSHAQHPYQFRPLTPLDNAGMAAVVRRVSAEYGLTPDRGFGVADPTLDTLSDVYQANNAAFWVIEKDHRILGGGGIAPLAGQARSVGAKQGQPSGEIDKVCELQKMYFLPELRGLGFARKLAATALKFAREQGYTACYLETTACLEPAIKLYQSLGFQFIDHAMGNTGHDACEIRMLKHL